MSINNILDQDVLQQGLNSLSHWAEIWQLQVSVPKCSVLHLGSRNGCRPMSYDLNGVVLPDVKSVVDLGVTVDSNLRYKLHINNIVTKAHQRACLIMRCFKSRDPTLLFKAFCVYVRPLVEYCVPVCHGPLVTLQILIKLKLFRDASRNIYVIFVFCHILTGCSR